MKDWTSRHSCPSDDTVRRKEDDVVYMRRFISYNAKHETMKQAYEMDVLQYKHKMVRGVKIELEKDCFKIEFVAQAVEILLQCRRTLMHSYIFSYFMTTLDNQMYIFEANLKYLEQSTEQLSEILEYDVTPQSLQTVKEKIINGTDLCNKRRNDLMNHIKEGYNEGWWRKFPIKPEELLAAEMLVDAEAVQRLLY